MRAAIYVRVSTKDQNTELQEAELRAFAASRGWNATIYSDKATGTNTDRPAFQKLMKEARSGNVDVILVWKLDRMFRSMRDLTRTLSELTENDVEFVSLKENLDLTTAAGKMLIHIIGSVAEFEASMIRERTAAGRARAKANGVRFGRPLDYRKVDYEAVRQLHASGKGPSAIARELKIARASVYRILNKYKL